MCPHTEQERRKQDSHELAAQKRMEYERQDFLFFWGGQVVRSVSIGGEGGLSVFFVYFSLFFFCSLREEMNREMLLLEAKIKQVFK
jgi:hypothetical protein